MRYRLGIEEMENNHWVAWVFDLPGCFSSGQTRAEAISNAGASIAAYRQWIAARRQEPPVHDPYMDIHVVEVYQPSLASSEITVNAFFDEDRMFLDAAEIAAGLELLEFTRVDLLSLVAHIPPGRRAERHTGETLGSTDDILRHIATAEWGYLDRLDLAFPNEYLPEDPIERLDKVRACLRSSLPLLAEDDRIVAKDGETWSVRKIVRRALGHERDHTQHIARLSGI
jgi:predicted RNase H-like HicB family nuclease